jgi:D-alanyl-lipoteichoic acid acyltransferase DltB (MBOAT superfamily)
MVFSSVTFLFYFLPIFLACYVLTPTVAAKNVVTLLFSLVFYAWGEPRFLLILLFSIAFNYVAAIVVDRYAGAERKWALALAVAVNLAVLGLFKYANFVTVNFAALLKPLGHDFGRTNIELPLGISFFTFHCLSYIIDVYRRRFRANANLVDVALYISLFPQLVAGPIVRYKTVARQLDRRRQTLGRASVGTRIFIIGLAQKVLVADVVAPLAQVAFDHSPHRTLAEAWIGLLAYTVQIYFDFAGYSNMAIGLGVVLGFTFPRNFNLPYTSLSITEFWRRWHMSLSSWLRDYLYVPLGGNRGSDLRTYRNLITVFVLCGVWHGANWTFVLWGGWHGAFLVVERLGLKARLAALPGALRWLYALLAVMGGWVLFRSADLSTADDFFLSLFGLNGAGDVSFDMHDALNERAIATLVIGSALATLPRVWPRLSAPLFVRAAADTGFTFALLIFSMITVASGAYSPFLYFKF